MSFFETESAESSRVSDIRFPSHCGPPHELERKVTKGGDLSSPCFCNYYLQGKNSQFPEEDRDLSKDCEG